MVDLQWWQPSFVTVFQTRKKGDRVEGGCDALLEGETQK